jgi:hypothetical protein
MPSLAEGTQQLWHPKDVDGALEVVSQAREAEFSSHVLEPLHEEIALIIGVFASTQWVFNELLALLHDCRVGFEPRLHALENVVLLEPDVAAIFKAATAVNAALRMLAKIAQGYASKQ